MAPETRPEQNQPRPLSDIVRAVGADTTERVADTGRTVSGITHDSRQVRPGDLYAALPGEQAHGADFSRQAVAAGATAILTDPAGRERAAAAGVPVLTVDSPRSHLGSAAACVYGHPADSLLLIGTTGTSGKTTVTYLVESGLRASGMSTGLVGTVEMRVGDDRVQSSLTTPEATDLHGLLAVMRERGVAAAAMEVSSHALALGRVGETRYDVAVFTNLSQDHLDFHTDLREYFETKARLFTPEHCSTAVINRDDQFGRALVDMVEDRGAVEVTTFSTAGDAQADWRALDIRSGADGSTFHVVGPGGVQADASVCLPGPFNVSNALAAIVALVDAGVPLQEAVRGVSESPGVPGRMERVDEGQDFTALVDYSHKPGAIEAVLGSLREVTRGRVIIVLGCGGDRDRAKRPLMGETASALADMVIVTNDNPRSEDPITIITGMLDGVTKVPPERRAGVTVEPDRAAAISLAVDRAASDDVVVVAGKGHERGQYVGSEVVWFDDREVLREALRRRAGT
ncbi:UDP-N-acetylmuramoylalanyl-D-glutamate--2,6-diaminopimelate ligase [Haloactinospora alba]|uniref:UDP-N-acetylmuramoyl-L-alanyl-D-glutamate--2,6-diaminopimelate ligase n=1 Tax=Haloactinospora alba TaxID=405555 RepID=A0A543NJP2_9ACTN|nr:UDP-N-acetylmuramoyl-L-alanyl-D-glutamate--2,6-diaminopimelate ligase [Haloactinospora alba]TQN31990.1 UDP-N-acetylmuramoylalanyl-D-glutamate--2,6-diaminopimelate ligase [Haloactinospora alba]